MQYTLTRRGFLQTAAALSAAGLGAGISAAQDVGATPWDAAPEAVARHAAKDPSNIRLLQLTDIHFFCLSPRPRQDERTIEALPRLIDATEPDLLLVTGDLWHDNPDGRGGEYMAFAVEQLGRLGVPWLFTWGNHDLLDDYRAGHEHLTNAPNSLYRGGASGGNYVVEITDSSGNPAWDLVCLNSNDQGLGAAQHAWLDGLRARQAAQPGAKNAFALFHIPLRQMDDLWQEKQASGVKFESVAYRQEDRSTFAYLRDLRTVRACFCGHDHINDYSCRLEGMDLVYGRATGYAGYGLGRVPKGAKLITANAGTGEYAWESVTPDGARWRETPGVQIDRYEETAWARAVTERLGREPRRERVPFGQR